MAINAPNHAPTVAAVATPTAVTSAINVAAGNLNGAYFYKVTFVSAFGESAPSPASASVSPATQQVNLTAIPTGPAGTVSRNIYRAKGVVGNPYGLVANIPNNSATTLTDNALDAVQTAGVAPPVGNLTGVYLYAFTNYSPSFGESPLGPVSGSVSPSAQPVLVSTINNIANNTSERRLYRSKNNGVFQFVTRFTTNPTSYQDNFADSAVGTASPIGQIVNPFIASKVIRRRSPGEPVSLTGALELRGQRYTQRMVARRNSSPGLLRRIGQKSLG